MWTQTNSRAECCARRWAWAALCLAVPGGVTQAAEAASLFEHSEMITLELRGPFKALLRDRYGKPTYRAGELRYQGSDQVQVTLPVEIRPRGKTRRSKDVCAFPPLRVRFAAGAAEGVFTGQKSLKLVTHCHDKGSYDQYVLREYLAYRIYNLLTERSHRVRLARVTYVESAGRVLTTRYGIFLEDWRAVAARNGLEAADVDGAVNIDKLSTSDANRVAVFQYMIGNQDWSVLWPEPRENCCHNTKPLLAPDGTVVPLPYDFDYSGLVNAPYARAKGGSDNVRLRRYGGLCVTQSELTASLPLFRDRRAAIYALFRDQPGVERRHLKSSLNYLDGFYRIIDAPDQVERRMIRRCKAE